MSCHQSMPCVILCPILFSVKGSMIELFAEGKEKGWLCWVLFFKCYVSNKHFWTFIPLSIRTSLKRKISNCLLVKRSFLLSPSLGIKPEFLSPPKHSVIFAQMKPSTPHTLSVNYDQEMHVSVTKVRSKPLQQSAGQMKLGHELCFAQ